MSVSIFPVEGIPEAEPGDDLAGLLIGGLAASGLEPRDGDVLVVTHKLVSKAEGRIEEIGDDPAARLRVIAREASAVIRRRDELVTTETHHGFVC
ncbi:MAG: coenzyme F420-0:L-glutamate ligase, partial [bacterium]|nr:coenzyme F420-0:L-glutamate ligase [bacterium]